MQTLGITIPIVGSADVFAGSADRAISLLERIATSTEAAGKKADETKAATDRMAAGLDHVASRARDGIEVFQLWAGRVASLVNGVAELATEQQRLDRASERLGLNFAQAADGASGYVDVLQVMQGATNAASRDLRLSQRELDAFTRVAAQTARDRGQEFSQVFEQLVEAATEGGEEFAKFGTTMGAVAETSHSVQERLSAVVARAGELSTTADLASDRIARLRGELRDAGRAASESFINELLRLETVAPALDGTTTRTRDLREELRAAGQAAAFVVSGITNGLGLIVGAVAVGVRGIVSFAHITGAALANVTSGPGAVSAAVRAAASEEAEAIDEILAFTRQRAANLAALADDRGPEAASAAAAPAADMVFTLDGMAAEERNRTTRDRREAGSGGRSRTQRATLAQLMERAVSGANNDFTGRRRSTADSLTVLGEAEEGANALGKSAAQRAADEAAFGQSDEARMRERREQERTEQERVQLDNRYRQQQSFTENLEALYARQGSASESLAQVTQAAFSGLTETLADEADAVLRGQKSVGEALESGGKKMLNLLARQAWAKAALFGAEALGNVVLGNFARAGVAAKAAAGYLGAGVALSAVAGAADGQGAEPSASAPSAPAERMPSGDRTSAAAPSQIVHNYYAPRIGGRDAASWEVGEQLSGYTDDAQSRTRRDR